MTRQEIVESVLNAYTLPECEVAEKELKAWLNAPPDDIGLYEIAGMLGIVKSAAQKREIESMLDKEELAPAGSL